MEDVKEVMPNRGLRGLLAVLVLLAIASMGASQLRGWKRGSAAPITGVDPNVAAWWELAELPQVGESLARRIVEYRGTRPAPAFRRADDLRPISGVGPVLLQKIGPDLVFDSHAAGGG